MLSYTWELPKSQWESEMHARRWVPDMMGAQPYQYRDKQDRHETPSGVRYNDPDERRYNGSIIDTKPLWGPHNVPDSEYEALMVCAPHTEPQSYNGLYGDIDELFGAALALLTPKERSVVELVVFGQMSLAQAGVWLAEEYGWHKPYSKMLVSKYRDSAFTKLRKFLEETL